MIAYINKQGGTHSVEMFSPVENQDLVPSLQNIITCQAHSRMPKCDGQLVVQVESDTG